MSSEADLNHLIADWLAVTRDAAPTLPLGEREAERRAAELLHAILDRRVTPASIVLGEEAKQILSMLVRQLADSIQNPERKLHSADAVYQFIRRLTWPGDAFGEQQDLLAECAEIGWGSLDMDVGGIARRRLGLRPEAALSQAISGDPSAVRAAAARRLDAELPWSLAAASPFSAHRMSQEEARKTAEEVLATSIPERLEKAHDLCLEDPELLFGICEVLCSRFGSSPAEVRNDAEFFYQFLGTPRRRIGLFDECEYFLGELARIAGTASRLVFRREEGHRWFDRAELHFSSTSNGLAHVARVAYQRLALMAEERRFGEVLKLVPELMSDLSKLGLVDDALKCQFLEAVVMREIDDTAGAVRVLKEVCGRAGEQGNLRIEAEATNNLAGYCGQLGNLSEAMAYARKAFTLLKQTNDRIGLAKLRWFIGDILREQGNLQEAITTYREALDCARDVGTRGDEAAIHLVLADVLLDVGQNRQAEWEVRAALPIIEEEKMVPEGYAALSLLRDALRVRQVDRKALRQLHGYFRDSQS